MRPINSLSTAVVFSSLLASPAFALFDGAFSVVGAGSPAGYYGFTSGVTTLGNWSVAMFAAPPGDSYVDTTLSPIQVTIGASTVSVECEFSESTTVFFIEIPEDGRVSFTIQVNNTGSGESFLAGAEVYLDGIGLYTLTDPDATHTLEFDAFAGNTLEFRSMALAGSGSLSANITSLTGFNFIPSAIPEPDTAAVLLGLASFGVTARRRRVHAG